MISDLQRARLIASKVEPAFEVMWSALWPIGHCAVASLVLAPMLRASLEIDYRVVVGMAHDCRIHAWVESPDGAIIDPSFGQFSNEEPALVVLSPYEANRLGHCGEIKLTLDEEEHFRRSIKPRSMPDGWGAGSGIKQLFHQQHPIINRHRGDS